MGMGGGGGGGGVEGRRPQITFHNISAALWRKNGEALQVMHADLLDDRSPLCCLQQV